MNCQDDDVSAYVKHLNVLNTIFKIRFEDILTIEISQWINNPYSEIGYRISRRTLLIGISTNGEFKIKFSNGY